MKKSSTNFNYIRYLNDAGVIMIGYLATMLTLFGYITSIFSPFFLVLSLFFWYLMSNFSKLYADRRSNKFSEEIIFILYHVILFAIILS